MKGEYRIMKEKEPNFNKERIEEIVRELDSKKDDCHKKDCPACEIGELLFRQGEENEVTKRLDGLCLNTSYGGYSVGHAMQRAFVSGFIVAMHYYTDAQKVDRAVN